MSDYIILKCVKEKNKLRVKFHLYVDVNGKKYEDVYNNTLNCRFPRDKRVEGKFYKINANDLSISYRKEIPFYNIKFSNIQNANMLDALKDVYTVEECVICMDSSPNITLISCGHKVTCSTCYEQLRHKTNKCPICRKIIEQAYLE